MKITGLGKVAVSAALVMAAGRVCALRNGPASPKMTGEYIEARTCNVYTGACHANGELVTAGREAVLAWQVNTGSFEGADLANLNAAAVMVSTQNLAAPNAQRRSLLYVDSRATPTQRSALADALRAEYGSALGQVLAVKPAAIEIAREGKTVSVRVPNVA